MAKARAPDSAADTAAPAIVAGVLIAIPLYKAPELLPELFAALAAMADEIHAIGGRILFLNDSPDHAPLRAALDAQLPPLRSLLDVELVENPANLGFVQTANRALAIALEREQDVLLLNSDALPTPGAFAEMAAVSRLDPMISVVSPRSDNATICNSPYPPYLRNQGRTAAFANHRAIERWLPRMTYVPTAVGFCIYIRHLMLREFGLFDEIYGGGYNEENDFILRCNQRGYRAILANHAYVHHLGSVSFAQSGESPDDREARNGAIVRQRYPEYDRSVDYYFEGAEYRTQRLLAGLIPDAAGRTRLLFDCRQLSCSHNGTCELSRRLVEAFARQFAARYDITILAHRDAFDYHGFDRIASIRFCEAEELRDRPFGIAFRIGQPFTPDDLAVPAGVAPITGFLMLDTIGLDCQQLDEQHLEMLWGEMIDATDLLGYISQFGREQFHRRFDVPAAVTEFVSLCSTDVADYGPPIAGPVEGEGSDGPSILLVGNHYPHKHVGETVAALRAGGCNWPITILGQEVEGEGITNFASGDQPQGVVDDLYARASVVLFPSHYEGFGLPVLHALARSKPVIARALPPLIEIRDRSPYGHNVHLAVSTADLVRLVLSTPSWQAAEQPPARPAQTWNAAADALAEALDSALLAFDFQRCRRNQARIAGARAAMEGSRRKRRAAGLQQAADVGMQLLFTPDEIALWVTRARARAGLFRRSKPRLIDVTAVPGPLDEAQRALLLRVQRIPIGSRIRFIVPLALLAEPGTDVQPADYARILLHDAGCWVEGIEFQQDILVARAIKFRDWADWQTDHLDDAEFIAACYRRGLGRQADKPGVANFMQLLSRHGDRNIILAGIYASAERRRQLLANT